MTRFQGWTPATIDNLTFDQLDAIVKGLNKNTKRAKSDGKEKIDLAGVPSSKGNRANIEAWCKAGCPSTFKNFVKGLRKRS